MVREGIQDLKDQLPYCHLWWLGGNRCVVLLGSGHQDLTSVFPNLEGQSPGHQTPPTSLPYQYLRPWVQLVSSDIWSSHHLQVNLGSCVCSAVGRLWPWVLAGWSVWYRARALQSKLEFLI